MTRAFPFLLLLLPVAIADDEPAYRGRTADEWAAALADRTTRDEAGAALAAGGPEALTILDALIRARRELDHLPDVLKALPDARPLVPPLIDLLGTDDAQVRRQAARALWRIGDPAVRILVEAFRRSTDRARLGEALTAGGRDALPYLAALLADADVPWCADAETALALIGWEALCVLPAGHPSVPRVTELVLGEGVVRRVTPPKNHRTVPGAPPLTTPLPTEATWETGSGHGFTLALCRAGWTPDGLSVRTISYTWKRPRGAGGNGVETVAVRTTTIPRPRAEAMLRMILAITAVTFEKERGGDLGGWSSSADFHAAVLLRTGDKVTFNERYTGYANSLDEVRYARVQACARILGEALETCTWTDLEPSDEDHALLAARLARIADDGWWVRERLLLIAGAIGDARCIPPLKAFIETVPDAVPRAHRYAIDAYAKISGIDLRPTPFRDEDVAATRARYLQGNG